MSTRLEGVQIPVELDTTKAQRQLDNLERSLNRTGGSGGQSGSRAPSGSSTRSGSGSMKPRMMGGMDLDLAEDLYNELLRQIRIDRIRKFGTIRVEQANRANSFSGIVNAAATKAVGEGFGGAMKLAGGLYAGISAVAKNAPLALEAGRAAVGLSSKDPNYSAVQAQLGNLQNAVNYLESYLKSAVTGIGKTYDMATAMARVHGKVPNIQIGYGIYKEADLQEDMLKRKFESFQKLELAEAVGNSMLEFFKGGINR